MIGKRRQIGAGRTFFDFAEDCTVRVPRTGLARSARRRDPAVDNKLNMRNHKRTILDMHDLESSDSRHAYTNARCTASCSMLRGGQVPGADQVADVESSRRPPTRDTEQPPTRDAEPQARPPCYHADESGDAPIRIVRLLRTDSRRVNTCLPDRWIPLAYVGRTGGIGKKCDSS